MKIRGDFVTNSSSSSFLLCFKDEASVRQTLEEQFPVVENGYSAGEDGYLNQLLDEINEAPRLSKEDVIQQLKYKRREDIERSIRWDFELKQMRKGKPYEKSYEEAIQYVNSPEVRAQIDNTIEEEKEAILKKLGDNKIIVEVEHGDGGEGEDGVLERDILPTLKCTLISFSHH